MKSFLILIFLLAACFAAAEDTAALQARFQSQLKKLADENFDARVAAANSAHELLDNHDDLLRPLLKEALAAEKNPDVRTRLEAILESVKSAGHIEWLSENPINVSEIVASSGRVVACGSGKIACFNADNGKQIWSAEPGGLLRASLTIDGGKVLFIRSQKKNVERGYTPECAVFALDLATGKGLWSWGEDSGSTRCSEPVVTNGTLYVCREKAKDANFELIAIDTATGKPRWANDAGKLAHIPPPPAVSDGKLICYSETNGLCCLDEKDGKAIWSSKLKAPPIDGVVIDKNNVYVAGGGQQCCLDLQSGMMRWSVDLRTFSCPPAVAAGKLYCRTDKGLTCLDANTGQILWNRSLDVLHGIMRQPVVVKDRFYFVFGSTPVYYCLSTNDGSELWRFQESNINFHKQFPIAGGRMFIAHLDPKTHQYYLAALKTNKDGPADWPMQGGNAGRSGCNDALADPKP